MPQITAYTTLVQLRIKWQGENDVFLGQMKQWKWTSQNHFIVGYSEKCKIIIDQDTQLMWFVYPDDITSEAIPFHVIEFKAWVKRGLE